MATASLLRLAVSVVVLHSCHSKVCGSRPNGETSSSLLQRKGTTGLNKPAVPEHQGLLLVQKHTVTTGVKKSASLGDAPHPSEGAVLISEHPVISAGFLGNNPKASLAIGVGIFAVVSYALFALSAVHAWIFETALMLSYMALYLGCATLGHYTRDLGYSSLMLVLLSTLFKVAFALGLWRCCDGTFNDLFSTVRAEWKILIRYALPALCYTVGDTLRTHVLRVVDPSTFLVLFNTRMFLLGLVWERFMNRRLNAVNWGALLLIFVGCTVKELPHVAWGTLETSRLLAYAEIVCIGCVNAYAAVANEHLLKFQSQISVNCQNLAMYAWGLVWAFCGMLAPLAFGSGMESSVFEASQWRAVLMEPIVLVFAVAVAVLGITTAFLLKLLSNIHREVAVGAAMVCSLPVDFLLFGYAPGAWELNGTAVVLAGVVLFAAYPVQKTPPEQKEQQPQEEKQEREDQQERQEQQEQHK